MNENTVKGKWKEIKGEVQKAWGNLTDDELDKTQGDIKAVEGLIQQRYGSQQEDYKTKLSVIYSKFTAAKNEVIEKVKDSLKT